MKLYEINEGIESILNALEGNDDKEVDAVLRQALSELEMQESEKLDNIASYIKQLNYEAEAIKKEIDGLNTRLKAKKGKVERLENYLKYYLLSTGAKKFESSKNKITIAKCPSKVKIINDDSFVMWCKQHGYNDFIKYSKPDINKTAVKEALKAGLNLAGVTLEEGQKIRIK